MQKNDDPAVVEKFNNLLDITSRPTHLNLEKRVSQRLITTPTSTDVGNNPSGSESSDDSDDFMDALENTMDQGELLDEAG